MIAAVLVRGLVNVRHDAKAALAALNLRKKHLCVLLEETPERLGQLRRAKDFITYGRVSEETVAALRQRGDAPYPLPPPLGGWKGTKKSFAQGGALGDRGSMDDLLKRMLR